MAEWIRNGESGLSIRTKLNSLYDDVQNMSGNTSGSSGTSGLSLSGGTSTSGTSGGVGTSGTSGETGTSGTSGGSTTSGTSGGSGTSGTSGGSGTSGSSGSYDLTTLIAGTGITFTDSGLTLIISSPQIDGFMDYNHSGSTQSYTGTTGYFMKVINDGLGTYTQKSFKPYGVTELWNTITNQFNFSELSIGDEVIIRTDGDVTTTTQNQIFGTKMTFDIGGFPYDLQLSQSYYKSIGTYHVNRVLNFYIGNVGTRDNPAELYFHSDSSATVKLNGFYISVKRRK